MAGKPHDQMKAFVFLQKILLAKLISCSKISIYLQRKASNYSHESQPQIQTYPFPPNETLMFHLEGAVLKSSSLFPYFMLVAFEGGGLLRAFILFLLHPIIWLVGKEWGLKIMVFVSFIGLKEESFRVGRAVLPKFLLEDVGNQVFDVVTKSCSGRKIGVTDMPRIMVECFLKDYLKVDVVVGRELKVVWGHFVGLMEEKKASSCFDQVLDPSIIGITSLNRPLSSCCEVVYMVSEADKKKWQTLPKEKYPRPLIFHDGRLGFRPTPVATLYLFMWIPFGILLLIVRAIIGYLLPYKLSMPFLSFTGLKGTLLAHPHAANDEHDRDHDPSQGAGVLYVCNHKTLLDPIYVSMGLGKPLTAVTYSLSRATELFSPIKTVRLTRNREADSKMIEKQLKQGDLVICPEGTTCREPYLLRFSPLFAEISDEIVPIAIDFQASMFFGTTASGFKFLDPVFLLMSPTSHCSVAILEKLPKSLTCQWGGKSKFEVANHVQAQIAKALNYECTSLTRRDKYMILAGNEGIVV